MMSEPFDQDLTLLVMLASAPCGGHARRVGVAEFGDVRAALAAGQRVGPVGGAVAPRDPVHDHLGVGLYWRELLVELRDDAVHPGDLRRDGRSHPPHGQLGRRGRRPTMRAAARAAACDAGRGSCERDGSADRGCRSGEFHCSISLPGCPVARVGAPPGGDADRLRPESRPSLAETNRKLSYKIESVARLRHIRRPGGSLPVPAERRVAGACRTGPIAQGRGAWSDGRERRACCGS